MNIFLAGATGAVGRLLVPMLVEAGHTVTGTSRSVDKLDFIAGLGAEPVVLDVYDPEATLRTLQDAAPDVVIHQLTDLSTRDWAGNARLRTEGTPNLVEAAKAAGVQRMIAQSIAWMSVPGAGPATEADPLDVDAPEARSRGAKAVQALENAVAQMPVGVILRYGLLYGPATWYARDGLTTEQIQRGEIPATDAVSSFVHVEDAARAAVDALDWPAGIYNIVDDAPAAGTEWVPLYARLVSAPEPTVRHEAQPWERGSSNAKAKSLGWLPKYPDWRAGFEKVLTSS